MLESATCEAESILGKEDSMTLAELTCTLLNAYAAICAENEYEEEELNQEYYKKALDSTLIEHSTVES
jgi:hypothetical protein